MWITNRGNGIGRVLCGAVLGLAFWVQSGVEAGAQDDGRFLFTAGTTYTATNGTEWAYLQWQATEAVLLDGRVLAVYRKTGRPTDAGRFERVGIVGLQTDPLLLEALIGRGEQLGDPAEALMADVASLFSGLALDEALTDGEVLLQVIMSSLGDADAASSLVLLARKHPAVGMALGQAFATRIEASGFTTFEIREYDMATDTAGVVLGRVTVEGGNPVVLPAPENMVEVVNDSPQGNLNVGLRWDEPADLLRLSLLHFGYNVYRMDAGFAADNGFDASPPGPDELRSLLAGEPDAVQQVNRLPVIANDAAEADDPFFVDDNNRYDEGGEPFADGAEYVYFITARDLLGRDGAVSDGLYVQVCDRFPPVVPKRVQVERQRLYEQVGATTNYVATNVLRVIWNQNASVAGDETVNYHVYRYASTTNSGFRGTNVTANRIAVVPHVPGATTNSYVDRDLTTNDFGRTYWYTVQAADGAACGPNYSGHSAPGFGALVDWQGPPSGGPGEIRINCLTLEAARTDVGSEALTDQSFAYQLIGEVRPGSAPYIDWMEFRWTPNPQATTNDVDTAISLGRHPADANGQSVQYINTLSQTATLFFRVGSDDGRVSPWVVFGSDRNTGKRLVVTFEGWHVLTRTAANEDCDEHEDGGTEDGPVGEPAEIGFPTSPETFEWRVYRRVDNGPLMLIRQGTNVPSTSVTGIQDNVVGTLYCSEICYYRQELDESGNAGQLELIGCIESGIRPPAQPQLSPIRPAGTNSAPAMALQWIASPYGVERFEVWIGMEEAPPDQIGTMLSTNILPAGSTAIFSSMDGPEQLFAACYLTPRIGPAFGTPGSSEFTLELPIALDKPYTVMIKARGECDTSAPSLAMSFAWYAPQTGPEVPWPARPLPQVRGDFHPRMEAVFLDKLLIDAPVNQVGIRVGEFPWLEAYGNRSSTEPFTWQNLTNAPTTFLYADINDGGGVLPMLIYRQQTATTNLTAVSGDVVQVSPLLETISHEPVPAESIVRLRDPFFLPLPEGVAGEPELGYLYVLDTQPVISGAAYQYFVVLFDERFEPKRVIPLAPVEVP